MHFQQAQFNIYFISFYFCFKLSLLLFLCYYFCFPSFIFTINVTDIMCAKHHYAVDQLKFSKLKRVYVDVCTTYVRMHCLGVIIYIYVCVRVDVLASTLRRSFYFVTANENIIELNFQLSSPFHSIHECIQLDERERERASVRSACAHFCSTSKIYQVQLIQFLITHLIAQNYIKHTHSHTHTHKRMHGKYKISMLNSSSSAPQYHAFVCIICIVVAVVKLVCSAAELRSHFFLILFCAGDTRTNTIAHT